MWELGKQLEWQLGWQLEWQLGRQLEHKLEGCRQNLTFILSSLQGNHPSWNWQLEIDTAQNLTFILSNSAGSYTKATQLLVWRFVRAGRWSYACPSDGIRAWPPMATYLSDRWSHACPADDDSCVPGSADAYSAASTCLLYTFTTPVPFALRALPTLIVPALAACVSV